MIERPWTEPYYSVASDPQRFEDGLKVHNYNPAKVKKGQKGQQKLGSIPKKVTGPTMIAVHNEGGKTKRK